MTSLRSTLLHSRRFLFTSLLVLPCIAAAVIAGCGDDDSTALSSTDAGVDGNTIDAGGNKDSGTDSGPPVDAGTDGAALAAKVARGKYLVEAVAACGDCHTPRDQNGPIAAKYLSGSECFIDAVPDNNDAGCLNSANLTNDPTGLQNFTDDQIKNMFQNGVKPDGKFLNSVMPYYLFHNMTNDDADAVVAYLRTVPGVSHTAPANQPPFDNVPAAAKPIDEAKIPVGGDAGLDAGGDPANGRYLAKLVCIDCHTMPNAPGVDPVLQMDKVFGGGREFTAKELGLPSPPFPASIYTANLTPDVTGIPTYSLEDIIKILHQGLDRQDGGICPPMPAGPRGAFGNLTDKDALDIASYIHNLPPVTNPIDGGNGSCVAPGGG